jgi:hypothetical protein
MSLDPITAALDVGRILIEKIWPNPVDQARELRKLEELRQTGDIAQLNAKVQLMAGQLDINKIEAASSSLFVSGWRPGIGWICGFALGYAAILEPFMRFIAAMLGYEGLFPVIDTNLTMQVLLGMLGLAGMRTREKEKGVNAK